MVGSAGSASAATSTDELFKATTSNVTQMKISLFERVGEALGVDKEDYASEAKFYDAVASRFSALVMQEDSHIFIGKLEQELGLYELGVSLRTVVTAMVEPSGKDAEKLSDALEQRALASEEQAKADAEQVKAMEAERAMSEAAALKPVKDELGIYTDGL